MDTLTTYSRYRNQVMSTRVEELEAENARLRGFTALVREMREAQKSPYYENPSQHYSERIRAEHRVDRWLEENHEN